MGLINFALFEFTVNLNKFFSLMFTKIIMKFKGIKSGNRNKYFGIPYFYRYPDSKIFVGSKCIFRSDKTVNLSLKKRCIIRTLNFSAEISIGDFTGINASMIAAENKITIGKNVLIGYNCYITDTDNHSVSITERHSGKAKSKPVIICDNVWLGANVTVLKGVTIGENSVISAGSVVYTNIPPNVVAIGNPCKVIQKIE